MQLSQIPVYNTDFEQMKRCFGADHIIQMIEIDRDLSESWPTCDLHFESS